MDHLITARYGSPLTVRVPLVADRAAIPSTAEEWLSFPRKLGMNMRLDRKLPEVPQCVSIAENLQALYSADEQLSFLQTWLYFGTLNVLCCFPNAEFIGFADFVRGDLLDERGQYINSESLSSFIFRDGLRALYRDDHVAVPTMEDEPNLQYIRGCVKESMRLMPTDILGVPHASIQDDEYMGYRIPKGAAAVWNVWSIHMDPKRHPNPRVFDPARYVDDHQTASEAASNPDPSKRDQFIFGAGRRVCQGMHIAERSLFLGMSRMLWAFNFEKARDSHGSEITPDISELTEGLFVMPKRFPSKIVPRSEKHAQRIRQEWADCRSLLNDDWQWKEVPKGMAFSTYTPEKDTEV